jgi:hypothetical protein
MRFDVPPVVAVVVSPLTNGGGVAILSDLPAES